MALKIWPFGKKGPKRQNQFAGETDEEELKRLNAGQEAAVLRQPGSYSGGAEQKFWQEKSQTQAGVPADYAPEHGEDLASGAHVQVYKLVPPAESERLPPEMEQLHLNRLRELDFQERQQQKQGKFADALYGRKDLGPERAAIYEKLGFKLEPVETQAQRDARWDAQGKAKIDAAREELRKNNPDEFNWGEAALHNDNLGGLNAKSTPEEIDAYVKNLRPEHPYPFTASKSIRDFANQLGNPQEQTPEKLQKQISTAQEVQSFYKQNKLPFCNVYAREELARNGMGVGHTGEKNKTGPTANELYGLSPYLSNARRIPYTQDGKPDVDTMTALHKQGYEIMTVRAKPGKSGHVAFNKAGGETRKSSSWGDVQVPYMVGYINKVGKDDVKDISDKYHFGNHFAPAEDSPVDFYLIGNEKSKKKNEENKP